MTKQLLGILIATASLGAQAQERAIEYSEKITPFEQWIQQDAGQAAVLNLFDGFTEPVVKYTNSSGQPATLTDKLTMYVATTKTELNVAASAANLKAMITLENINAIDPKMKSIAITNDQLMQNVVAAGKPVSNFEWCSPGSDDILKPKAEKDLSYLNGKQFCAGGDRSICVETCFIFGKLWRGAIKTEGNLKNAKAQGEAGINAIKNLVTGGNSKVDTSNRREDLGVAMQSEFKYYVSDAEYGKPLAALTGINTPVRGVVEQTTFYYNQVFKYSKILSVIQESPTDGSKAVMTNILVMGVRTHSWSKPGLPDHLKGEGLFNTEGEGLTDGIPAFMKNMTAKIAGILEKGA